MSGERAVLWLAVSTTEQAADDRASMEAQEQALRETADRRGWTVIDTIRVPGASRRHYNVHEFVAAAESVGITDPARMFDHWQRRDFDILAAWHTDRLGREQSIMAEVIQRTIDAGARVWTETEGEIDARRYRAVIAMSGYSAASAVDAFTERRLFGMRRRVERGLPAARIKWTHEAVRNEKGEIVALQVDETKRRLFDDVFDLVVNERAALFNIEQRLAERGHAPIHRGAIATMLYHPLTWGHVTRHAAGGQSGKEAVGAWAYRREQPHPAAIIHWDAAPPVWTGETAERMMAELDRRKRQHGRARHPRRVQWFTGLFVCGECGWTLGMNGGQNLRCHGRYERPPICTSINRISLTAARSIVESLLTYALAHDRLPVDDRPASDTAAQLDAISRERDAITAELDALIVTQVRAHPAARERYQARIDALGSQLDALDARRTTLQARAAQTGHRAADTRAALRELRAMDDLWATQPAALNQFFNRVLGDWRIIIVPGEDPRLARL